MASKEAFDKSLNLSNLALIASGITIYPRESKLFNYFLKCIFYFNILWLYTDVLAELYWLIEGVYEGKSFSELSFIAPCATICLLATAKSTPMHIHRDVVIEVVAKLRKLHPKDNELKVEIENTGYNNDEVMYFENSRSDDEMKIVKDSMKFLNIFVTLVFCSRFERIGSFPTIKGSKWILGIGTRTLAWYLTDLFTVWIISVVVVLFTTLPIMSMGYDYYTTEKIELKLPFLAKYFFDPLTKTMWPIMYFHQVWSSFNFSLFIACIAANNVLGADTLLYSFCAYIRMHFVLLCKWFEDFVSLSSKETEQRLVQLVKRHQELIHLVNQIEKMYTQSTLFNITTSSILICLSGFNVMILEDQVAVVAFMTFLTMSLTQISLVCLFGDMLMGSSLKLYEAIYNSRWYGTEGRVKKDILICLIRAQRPCRLTASNFAYVNLKALTTILSRSWSLFALLRTMYK